MNKRIKITQVAIVFLFFSSCSDGNSSYAKLEKQLASHDYKLKEIEKENRLLRHYSDSLQEQIEDFARNNSNYSSNERLEMIEARLDRDERFINGAYERASAADRRARDAQNPINYHGGGF
jgi:peptidoglycan hydrolase CwlO-like protein